MVNQGPIWKNAREQVGFGQPKFEVVVFWMWQVPIVSFLEENFPTIQAELCPGAVFLTLADSKIGRTASAQADPLRLAILGDQHRFSLMNQALST